MTPQRQPTRSNGICDIRSMGCLLVFVGIVGAMFGMAGMLGIIKNLELKFLGIELNN